MLTFPQLTVLCTKKPTHPATTTWDVATIGSNMTLSNGSLTATKGVASTFTGSGVLSTTSKSSGKWLYELTWAGGADVGIGSGYSVDTQLGSGATSYGFEKDTGSTSGLRNGGVIVTSIAPAVASGNTVSVALDLDNNLVYFAINGTWWNSGNPSAGTGGSSITAGTYLAAASLFSTVATTANFGQSAFVVTMPTGFTQWG